MAIRFKHRGVSYTADTPEEAARLAALLKRQDTEDAEKLALNRVFNQGLIETGGPGTIMALIKEDMTTPWTPEVFLSFIERLGESQRKALSTLVIRRSVSDEDLRAVLGVTGNQALAGVLSGISKQAASLDIPARDIFSFENLRNAGKRRSVYAVADKFARIAGDMNWPGEIAE